MVEHIERQTKQKDAIRAALADCEEFISAQDLHRRLEDEGSKIGLATVYRQLNALADAGLSLKNPVMTASGTFAARESGEFYDLSRLGAVITKGVAAKPWKSTRPARLGCAKWPTATASPLNPTPWRSSDCALIAKRSRKRRRLRKQ